MSGSLLKLDAIGKSFHGVTVLHDVSFDVPVGQVLGLIGENGAGKSTLMNIIGGVLLPDVGRMTISGTSYAPHTARDAQAAGIAFIHQELNLFSNLSIAENIFLTQFPMKRGLGRFGASIDRRAMYKQSAALLEQVGLSVLPWQRADSLSAGERQLLEIAKAIQLRPRLLILDEPTTSLTSRETTRLFELLQSLRTQGMALIYISHALGDVRQLCDRVVVLRDGAVVGQGLMEEFGIDRLVSLMVGRESSQQFPDRHSKPTGQVAFRARQVTQPGIVKDISFELQQGEVVGISGLMGSGRTELARILFGLDPLQSGTIEMSGQRIERLSTRERIQRGLAMLTESRRDDGLCMPDSIANNLKLVAEPKFSSRVWGILKRPAMSVAMTDMRQAVKLNPTVNPHKPVQTLSGGNQQKVVLGKWLLNEPKVLILDEPTRGIDVGAKFEIYGLIDQLATTGAAILIISSEIEELLGVCDRILVMSQGELRDDIAREDFDADRILRSSLKADQASEDAV
ncbi:MAG: sugar ABC transporter ATP-binding protein [Pirellulaceae bacterium]